MRTTCGAALAGAVVLVSCLSAQAAGPHKLLYSRDADVINSGDTVGGSSTNPALDQSGNAVFSTYSALYQAGPGVSFWSTPYGGSLTLDARVRTFPGQPDGASAVGPPLALWNAGNGTQLVEYAFTVSTYPQPIGLWTKSGATLTTVGMVGAPNGIPGGFDSITSARYSAATGQTAFRISAPDGSTAIMTYSNGTLATLAKKGDAVPGLPGKTFSQVGSPQAINDQGRTVFRGTIPDGYGGSEDGIFLGTPGSIALVAHRGTPTPGFAGGTFNAFNFPTINNAGQIAFSARQFGTNEPLTGVWRGQPDALQLIAGQGNAVSDRSGLSLGDFFNNPLVAMNAGGDVAFLTTVTGTGVTTANDEALFVASGSSLRTVYREGDQAPGLPDGVKLKTPGFQQSFAINAAGQVSFVAGLTGTGVTTANDQALYVEDAAGNYTLIAREGSAFVADGVTYPAISQLYTNLGSGGQDGMALGLTDSGVLAFRLHFTDNSEGVFLQTIPASVPEPVSLLIAGVGSLALLRRRC